MNVLVNDKKKFTLRTGNIFGLRDNGLYANNYLFPITSTLPKEGWAHIIAFNFILDNLEKYYKLNNSQIPQNVMKEVLETFKLSEPYFSDLFSLIDDKFIDKIIKRLNEKKPIIIPSGVSEHASYIAICPDANGNFKLIYSDRASYDGYLNKKYSVGNTSYPVKGKFSDMFKTNLEDHKLWILDFNTDLFRFPNKFKQFLRQMSPASTASIDRDQFHKKLKSAFKGNPNDSLPQHDPNDPLAPHIFKKQKTGNCIIANFKPIFFGLIKLLCPHLNEKDIIDEYKKFTTFLRISEIDRLIECTKSDAKKIAKEMLLAILIKLIEKNTQNQLENTRSLELLRHLIIQLINNQLYEELSAKLPKEHKAELKMLLDSKIKTIANIQSHYEAQDESEQTDLDKLTTYEVKHDDETKTAVLTQDQQTITSTESNSSAKLLK